MPEYRGERDDALFWEHARPRREPVRARFYLPGVLTSLVVSVPWYWSGANPIVLGLPVWVWAALGGSALLSAVTFWAAIRHWDDPES